MTPHARTADMSSAMTSGESAPCAQRPPESPSRPPVGAVGVVAGLLVYSARIGNAQCVFYSPFRVGGFDARPTLWTTWPNGPPSTMPQDVIAKFEQAKVDALRLFNAYRTAHPRIGRHNERPD